MHFLFEAVPFFAQVLYIKEALFVPVNEKGSFICRCVYLFSYGKNDTVQQRIIYTSLEACRNFMEPHRYDGRCIYFANMVMYRRYTGCVSHFFGDFLNEL